MQGHIYSTTKPLPTTRPCFSPIFPAPVPITMQTSLLLSTIQLALTGAELTCYYPDTTEATGHIPCNATASNTSEDASACCFGYSNDYCLANGLCWFDGILSRGSCTDKNWAAPSCAQWCQEGNDLPFQPRSSDLHYVRGELMDGIEQRNTSMNIFPCHREGVWQCEWHDDCPVNFTLQTSGIAVVLRDDQQPNALNAVQFADPNAKFVTLNQTNPVSSLPATAIPPAIASSTSASHSSTPTLTPAASPSLSAGGKAGVAVGAVVGTLAVGTLLYFLFVHRRRWIHREGTSPTHPPENSSHLYGFRGYGKHELTGQPSRMELDATGVKPELTAQIPRLEMGSQQ